MIAKSTRCMGTCLGRQGSKFLLIEDIAAPIEAALGSGWVEHRCDHFGRLDDHLVHLALPAADLVAIRVDRVRVDPNVVVLELVL